MLCLRKTISMALLSFSVIFHGENASARQINIQPTYQQTVVWCWAAVGEMVLKYFQVPNLNPGGNYQCGIVGSLGGVCASNCGACITTIGSTFQMADVLRNYQLLARQYRGAGFRPFDLRAVGRLSGGQIEGEIDSGNPVIIGISPNGMGAYYPPGMSEHVALVVGYGYDAGDLWLKINDPMPYGLVGYDPYLAAGGEIDRRGAYWISYDYLVHYLGYKDTIIVRN